MGGYGSGRWRTYTKQAVEDGLVLPISALRESLRNGRPWRGSVDWSRGSKRGASIGIDFQPEKGGAGRLRAYYTTTRSGGDKSDSDYWIDLEMTPCNFGGQRWWFLCPLTRNGRPCRRRCGKLYSLPGHLYFGCRRCNDLTYRSCQESHKFDSLFHLLAKQTDLDFETVRWALKPKG